MLVIYCHMTNYPQMQDYPKGSSQHSSLLHHRKQLKRVRKGVAKGEPQHFAACVLRTDILSLWTHSSLRRKSPGPGRGQHQGVVIVGMFLRSCLPQPPKAGTVLTKGRIASIERVSRDSVGHFCQWIKQFHCKTMLDT